MGYYMDLGEAGTIYVPDPGESTSLPQGITSSVQEVNGGEVGTIGQQSFSIFGTPYDQYKTSYSGTGPNGRQAGVTVGPDGRSERSFFVQTPQGVLILPESIAKRIDPNARPYEQTADGGYAGLGGLFDKYGTQALMAGVAGAGLAGLGAGAGAAADIGSAAFPLDAATVGGMNGAGTATVGAGSLGSTLQSYPLGGGMETSPWDEFYNYFNGEGSVLPQSGDLGSSSFPVFEGGSQVGANTTGATGLGQMFSSLPEPVQNLLRNTGLGGLRSLFGSGENGSFLGGGQQPNNGYQFPWGDVLGSLLEMYGANQQAKTLKELMGQAIDSDLWRKEQPKYFDPLYQATTKGIGDTAYGQAIADSTARSMATRGYNMSGNEQAEIAKSLHKGTVDYIHAVRPAAMGRGESNAALSLAQPIANAQNNVSGALGYGLQSVFNGSQPNFYEQLFRNVPKNNTLAQALSL